MNIIDGYGGTIHSGQSRRRRIRLRGPFLVFRLVNPSEAGRGRSIINVHKSACSRNSDMDAFICTACGTQYTPSSVAPRQCVICEEERQYVPPRGQTWTTLAALTAGHFHS